LTPLRNSLPRGRGQGTARQFRRITSWSNSGIGSIADKSPFVDSQTDTNLPTFGKLSLRRGPKIEYASDNRSAAYVEMSLSDQVNWVAQFAGQGFDDIRSLSQTALLWAHLGGEERAMLYGRGASGSGYAGDVSAPTISVTAGGTGGTIPAGDYHVVVTAKVGFGESAPAVTQAPVTVGAGEKLTVAVTAEPDGALGVYNVYVTAASGAANTATFQTQFVGLSVELDAVTTTGALAPTQSSAVQDNGYDGFLTVQSGPESGYFKNI